jgi:hypothetical protein
MIKITLSVAAALVLAAPSVTALAHDRAPVVEFSAAKKAKAKTRHVRVAPAERKIACTIFGCGPVPRGCTPVTGRDWWGNPSDYDQVVCR